MLSNAELIILGLVNEKPSYAYEIEKQIEAKSMRLWVRIGIASIYQVLTRLNGKGYLEFEIEREGKAPERKRYFLTEKGKEILKFSVKDALTKLEWYYLDLNVAIDGSDILSPEEIRDCLKRRLETVKYSLNKLSQDVSAVPHKSKESMIKRNVLALRMTEEKLLENLIEEFLTYSSQ
jgi:DNA-binding PadR family transcriptional regulator